MRPLIWISVFAWIAGASMQASAAAISYDELVGRMTNLEYLATLPQQGDTCAQWSSYDRASRYDAQTGKYIAWDANNDGAGFIRQEGDQTVMAEMEGPGCIWRIWSALAERGHVKIYLDGQPTPVTDLAFGDYFDGKHVPFNYPSLSYNLADQKCRGQNLYFPIPYQKSCKVVADKGWGAYFHFNYETFPKVTTVPTFSVALATEHAAALSQVDGFFRQQLGRDPAGARSGEEVLVKTLSVPPGQIVGGWGAGVVHVAELTGSRAITEIRVKMSFTNRDDEIAALRKIALRITWDNADKPAVWCPLGDFFGTAPGVNFYKSLPTGMTPDGFYALWYMPFEREARIQLVSEDSVERQIGIELRSAPLNRPFAGLGHFHAKWHRDVFPVSPDRAPDWTTLRTSGRGRFCGVMLHVWNPRSEWWGEGDEKFFVDGEKFPSTFGTGSEDYFGHAWGDPHLFQTAYHCQTMTQNNHGHQSLLRWHIVDNVPFQKSFEASLEQYFANADPKTLFACTTFWYLAPDGNDPFDLVPANERFEYWKSVPIQAAGFTVLGEFEGGIEAQDMKDFKEGKWEQNRQLLWKEARPGAKLHLALDAPASSAPRELTVNLTKASDYGIVQFYLDGVKLGEPIDLYETKVVPTGLIRLGGLRTVTPGQHKLTIEIVGANPKAVKSYLFGMDRAGWTE